MSNSINRRLCLSHQYHPLALMELLGRQSLVTAEAIIRRIPGEENNQIRFYNGLRSGAQEITE